MQLTDLVLALLEKEEFVLEAFLDEDGAGVLVDDGLFVRVFFGPGGWVGGGGFCLGRVVGLVGAGGGVMMFIRCDLFFL